MYINGSYRTDTLLILSNSIMIFYKRSQKINCYIYIEKKFFEKQYTSNLRSNYVYFRQSILAMSDTTLHKDESEMDIDDVMSSFDRDVLGGGDKDQLDEVNGGNSETSFKGGGFKGRKIWHGVIEVDWEGRSETLENIEQGVEGEGTKGAHDNTSVSDADIKPLYISPYPSISSKLNVIPISRKLTLHPVPTFYKPPFPVAIPRKAVATSRDGGLAIVNSIPVCNPFQPDFFTPNDKKAGCTVDLGFFKCKSTYSISFDLMRKCRVCRFDQ